jgi:hypothetical protein
VKTRLIRKKSQQEKLDWLFSKLMAAERRTDYWRQRIADFGKTDKLQLRQPKSSQP